MSRPKYKISINDLETRHNVNKLERDGFSRQQIVDAIYKHTDGASQQQRTKMLDMVYDRSQK